MSDRDMKNSEKEKNIGPSWVGTIIMLYIFPPVGLIMLFKRLMAERKRFKKKLVKRYRAFLRGKDYATVEEISKALDRRVEVVRYDLRWMLDANVFGEDAVFNAAEDAIYLVSEKRAEQRKPRAKAPEVEKEKPQEPVKQPAKAAQHDLEAKLREIKTLNDNIEDEEVSRRIDRMGELTANIFSLMRQKPEKADDARKFMNYYLPTTFKLLESYSLLEKQSYQGENIKQARHDIESILDTLIRGFEQQLDIMFKSEAIDISSDIEVLETMMASDGLTSSDKYNMHI